MRTKETKESKNLQTPGELYVRNDALKEVNQITTNPEFLKSSHQFDSNLIFAPSIHFYIPNDSSGFYYIPSFFNYSSILLFPETEKCIVARQLEN